MSRFILKIVFAVSLISAIAVSAAQLTADQAFQLSVKTLNETTIQVNWKIAPGYYIYRNYLSIIAENENNSGTIVGGITYPKATMENFKVFGNMLIYRNNLTVDVPVKKWGKLGVTLIVSYQGQKDKATNTTYPPIVRLINVNQTPSVWSTVEKFTGITYLVSFFKSLGTYF